MVTEQQIYFLNHKYVSRSYQITERSKDSHLQAKISIKKTTFNVLSGQLYSSCFMTLVPTEMVKLQPALGPKANKNVSQMTF